MVYLFVHIEDSFR